MEKQNDPFPDKMSFEELMDSKPSPEEMLQEGGEQMMDEDSWYNQAPYVAARLIIRAAEDSEQFREEFLKDEELGSAHKMSEYDAERHEKLNSIGLSAFQGGNAENLARRYLRNN